MRHASVFEGQLQPAAFSRPAPRMSIETAMATAPRIGAPKSCRTAVVSRYAVRAKAKQVSTLLWKWCCATFMQRSAQIEMATGARLLAEYMAAAPAAVREAYETEKRNNLALSEQTVYHAIRVLDWSVSEQLASLGGVLVCKQLNCSNAAMHMHAHRTLFGTADPAAIRAELERVRWYTCALGRQIPVALTSNMQLPLSVEQRLAVETLIKWTQLHGLS